MLGVSATTFAFTFAAQISTLTQEAIGTAAASDLSPAVFSDL